MELSAPFRLNDEGYALLQKFIYLRIEMDINSEWKELEALKKEQQQVSQKTGMLNSLKKLHKNHSVTKVEERISKKEAWKNNWFSKNISSLHPSLQSSSIQELISRFESTITGRIQLFLILQEVVHTPIYDAPNSSKSTVEETQFKRSIAEIAQQCGLPNIGSKIIDDTRAFFKDIKRENSNILKWGIYGIIGVSTMAAILAVPVIAPAIGGLMGLTGAAATASGLALLGGGSIAAGGLGMAGGMTVLVGGSGILGAIVGGATGKLLSDLPQEVIALNVVKVVNLINFLKSDDNRDRQSTNEILLKAQLLFLDFKEASEREIILNGLQKGKKESLQLLYILHTGLKKIL